MVIILRVSKMSSFKNNFYFCLLSGKQSFPLKVFASLFSKSEWEFESKALKVLTEEYCFICGRCLVYALLQSALNECPPDIQRPANFPSRKFDKELYIMWIQLYRYLESNVLTVLNACLATPIIFYRYTLPEYLLFV